MSDLSKLYQEIILGHNKQPRNRGVLADATHTAELNNPLCGDEVRLSLKVEDGQIRAARFEGEGCAIFRASASMMVAYVEGRSLEEVRARRKCLDKLLDASQGLDEDVVAELGDMAALRGVVRYPTRVKCAMLAWSALESALNALP